MDHEGVVEQRHQPLTLGDRAVAAPVGAGAVGGLQRRAHVTMVGDGWPARTGHFCPSSTGHSRCCPLTLDRSDPRPLGLQLADQVRRLVLAGTLSPGDRLPSTRRLAADLGRRPLGGGAGVGPAARRGLDRGPAGLRHAGWRAAPGRWRRRRPDAPRPRAGAPLVHLDAGTPWIDPRHAAAWRRAWREVSAATPPRGYDDPRGLPVLRELLAERLGRTRGLAVDPDDVVAHRRHHRRAAARAGGAAPRARGRRGPGLPGRRPDRRGVRPRGAWTCRRWSR